MKRLLTQAPALAYFDPCKGLTIQCDASGQGLGVALLQDGQPLAYASRALSGAETRYATIEKEMLAIVFAPEKWHQYTFGRPVNVYSDHKLLESITKKSLDRASKRVRDELAVTDGLIFRWERRVIPFGMRAAVKKRASLVFMNYRVVVELQSWRVLFILSFCYPAWYTGSNCYSMLPLIVIRCYLRHLMVTFDTYQW